MAIENLPLFNAMNKEEVKPPFHGGIRPPAGRPFTAQEAHMVILDKVNACIAEVNNFEHRTCESFKIFTDNLLTEDQAFKEAIQESYNNFQSLVQKEVNNFEASMTNDFTIYRNDLDLRFSEFVTSINNAYKTLENDVVEKAQKMSADYTSFINSANLAYDTFTTNVETHMTTQDSKINEAYEYMKANLPESTKEAIIAAIKEGEFEEVFYQVFGNPERFRGAFTYAEITALGNLVNGDYAFSTTDGHYYKWADGTWYDLGTGDLIANQFLEYVDNNSYTWATRLNNLVLNVDKTSKTVTLAREYDGVGLIFTPKRWTSVAEDKTFNFGEYVATSQNGYTGAVVYNVANAAIEMREMNTTNPHGLFTSEDIILFCAFFDAENGIKYFTYEPLDTSNIIEAKNKYTHKIFRRVCCVGDSYMAGYIIRNDTVYPTNEKFAMPHYMETATGNEWINCGVSGANVLTWQTADRGLAKAQASGKVQAYVIGLGLNDSAKGTSRYVSVGTSADIGTDAPTYYAGMSAIIRALNEINPSAKIFVCTCPDEGAAISPYNEAIRSIVNTYKETYPIHCLDLYENRAMFKADSLTSDYTGGHYTGIGYEQFAEIMGVIMSDYINDNIADFQNVPLIPYDTPFVMNNSDGTVTIKM